MAEKTLMYTIGAFILARVVWEFIQQLRNPSNEEVRKMTEIEGRVKALEDTIKEKVDQKQWEERSAKFDAFLDTINAELGSLKQEIKELREDLKDI